jgi:hypothetical protein
MLAQSVGAREPGGTCSTFVDALAGRLYLVVAHASNDVELQGFVPDGIDAVIVEFTDSTEVMVPVQSNSYYYRASKPTKQIHVPAASGNTTTLPATAPQNQ